MKLARRGAIGLAAAVAATHAAADVAPSRPAIMFNRWQEDWSVLADPGVPREPLDDLKYIPLSQGDPHTYLSFGADLRERFESNDAVNFGIGTKPQSYVISRAEMHADLRVEDWFQAFVQLQSDFAPGKSLVTPVDRDRLDLEQAFVALTAPVAGGVLKFRVGRQQIAFDLQRFISVRDGPNVRQSYDAIWAVYEAAPWRVSSFVSQPVQNRDLRAFDDFSSEHLTYGGFRVEWDWEGIGSISATLSQFKQDQAHFPAASGSERRDILDIRFAGAAGGYDWDLEAMGQLGRTGADRINAWAIGTRAGYMLSLPWSPRLGAQIDAASGDNNPRDHSLNTFNPLFPNGYYLALAGYTGFTNFIHVKPSVTVKPDDALTMMLAAGFQWRETTADAVFAQPDIAVPDTAGQGGRYTSTYVQARVDWLVTHQFSAAVEAVHFAVADAIRAAGGHDGTYVGVEAKLGW